MSPSKLISKTKNISTMGKNVYFPAVDTLFQSNQVKNEK